MKRWAFVCLLALMAAAWTGPADSQDRDESDLLDDLEQILREEKRKPNHDRALVRRLEALLEKHRGGGGSSGDSGEDAGESGRGDRGGSRGDRGGGRWGPEAIVGRVLDGIALDQEDREVVTRILMEFWASRTLVREYDHMDSYPDIQRDRNNRLARAVGQKKAKEIIDAIDALINRWARWGNRGG